MGITWVWLRADHTEPDRFSQKLSEFLGNWLRDDFAALLAEADSAPFKINVSAAKV
jgi:hypothetical protein